MALTDSLVRYWTLNDNAANTVVVDAVAGNNGTANVNTTNYSIAGKLSTAFDLDGSSEHIHTGYYIPNAGLGYSVAFWTKTNASTAGSFLSSDQGVTVGNHTKFLHYMNTDGKVIQYLREDSAGTGTVATITSSTAINDNAWHFVVCTYDGTNLAIYLDGSVNVVGSESAVDNIQTSLEYYIGAINDKSTANTFFDGIIDEMGLWTRALAASEITTLYNSGTGLTYPFNFPPVADFSADDTTPDEGSSVTFTDLSTNTPTDWSWDFGGGGTPDSSTDQNPVIAFNTVGTYTVALTAGNADGSDTETKTDYITVNYVTPTAAFSADSTSVSQGGSVVFTDASLGTPTSWSWVFESGTPSTSTTQSPTITYHTTGTFDVTLTATNSAGSDSEVKSNYITISETVASWDTTNNRWSGGAYATGRTSSIYYDPSGSNLVSARLTCDVTGTAPTFYLSANGSTSTNFETVTNGTLHTFTTQGKDLRVQCVWASNCASSDYIEHLKVEYFFT